ncbi:MAG: hypothetical protein LBV60_16560 [Streptomyces sp.]|jgi:hypothetical protein|nr:hypothetical protein [Streptomyces sp.]
MAMNSGYPADKALTLSQFVAKIHGLALAATLLKQTWQVHQQLGYFLLYGSYEADRNLAAFCTRAGYTTHAPGETFPPGPHRPALPARRRRRPVRLHPLAPRR